MTGLYGAKAMPERVRMKQNNRLKYNDKMDHPNARSKAVAGGVADSGQDGKDCPLFPINC
jgi:hypothetical protein